MRQKTTNPAAMANPSRVGDYFALLKPRVMSLVIFSALVGLCYGKKMAESLAIPILLPPLLQLLAVLFIAIGAGAAGALNMWIDRDIDAKMIRTMRRPLPQKLISGENALAFAIIFSVLAVVMLAFTTNYWAGGLLAFTILYYALVYSLWLKKRHVYNVVIGGVAGALPPVIGFVTVLPEFHWQMLLLFLLIFFWTPPHSWALAIFRGQDYRRANIKMLPSVIGNRRAGRHIIAYSLLMLPTVALFYYDGITDPLFHYFAGAITVAFFFLSLKFLWPHQNPTLMASEAKGFFYYSILYLFLFLLALLIDIW